MFRHNIRYILYFLFRHLKISPTLCHFSSAQDANSSIKLSRYRTSEQE